MTATHQHAGEREGARGPATLRPASTAASAAGEPRHQPGYDGVRGLAVAMIVVFHIWVLSGSPALAPIASRTWMGGLFLGVDLFFVLSGFLLALPWQRADVRHLPRPGTRRYFARRLRRIVPPYWLFLAVTLTLGAGTLIRWSDLLSGPGVGSLLAYIVFAQQLSPIASGGLSGVWGATWTLTIEMLFYFSLPLLISAFLGRRWRVALPVSLGVTLGWLALAQHGLNGVVRYEMGTLRVYHTSEAVVRDWLAHQFPASLFAFALGMCLARLAAWEARTTAILDRRARVMTSVALRPPLALVTFPLGLACLWKSVAIAAYSNVYPRSHYLVHPLCALGATLLLHAALVSGRATGVWGRLARRGWRWLPLRWLGVTGYSIFLWHLPMLLVIERIPSLAPLGSATRMFQVTLVATPALIVVGALLYRYVERPCIARPGAS